MEYYSAIKRNEVESVLVRWMNLEPVIESEVSQKEKNKYHVIVCIYIHVCVCVCVCVCVYISTVHFSHSVMSNSL